MITKQQAQQLCSRKVDEPIHQQEIEEILEYYIFVRKQQTVKVSLSSPHSQLHPMLFGMEVQKGMELLSIATFWLNQNHF